MTTYDYSDRIVIKRSCLDDLHIGKFEWSNRKIGYKQEKTYNDDILSDVDVGVDDGGVDDGVLADEDVVADLKRKEGNPRKGINLKFPVNDRAPTLRQDLTQSFPTSN